MAHARRQHDDPLAFVSNRELFGDLVDHERFAAAYRAALSSLYTKGSRATVEELV
jgi:mannitol 2-dehydrogenase